MKRSRSNPLSPSHTCPYSGCAKQFRSAHLLERHTSVHSAAKPLPCTIAHCTQRFAYASERDAHIREAHSIRRKSRNPATHVLGGGDDVSPEYTRESCPDETDHNDLSRDSQLVDEADEIVSNAAYLASQMKVVRSYEIAKWQRDDYQNAHQWARWVEESLEDFPDMPYLERKIKEKGLSITALKHAERAFFDSVLAYEGFSQEILTHLLTAALTVEGKERDAEDAEARMECLSVAITEAVERKNRLRIAADLAGQLQKVVGLQSRDETPAAKGEILLSRHRTWDTERVKEHISKLDTRDIGVFEVVCHEAIIGHDANVEFRDVLFEACRRGIRDGAAFGVAAELVADVSERDVSFFDMYLSWLLGRLGWNGGCTQLTQRKEENVDDVKFRIRSLAQRKGPIGYITRCAVEQFARRTGMRDLVRW